MIRTVFKLGLVALLIAATSAVHARIPSESRAERGAAFIPRPDTVRAIAFGFDAVLADFYWLWAVQIVGGEDDPSQHATDLGFRGQIVDQAGQVQDCDDERGPGLTLRRLAEQLSR